MRKLERSGRASSFFQKRARAFALIGPLLVLSTFVSREVIRDNLKDKASALETSEQFYVLRDSTSPLVDEVEGIQFEQSRVREQAALQEVASPSGPRSKLAAIASEEISYTSEMAEKVDIRLQEIDEFFEGDAWDDDIYKTKNDLDERVSHSMQGIMALRESIGQPEAVMHTLAERAGDAEDEVHELTIEMDKLSLAARKNLHSKVLREHDLLMRYTIITDVLFLLGWVVSYVGALYRVPEMKTES